MVKQNENPVPLLMTAEDIAFEVRCGVRKAQRLIGDGAFPQVKKEGRRFLVPRWAFESYVADLPEVAV